MTTRSIHEPAFHAATTPIGIAASSETINRRDRQSDGRLDALGDQLGDRQVGEDRDAEIAVQQTPYPRHELDVKRLIKPELLPDPGDVVQCRGIAGDDDRRVAGAQMQQREDEQSDDRHDRDRRKDAPDDIGKHASAYAIHIRGHNANAGPSIRYTLPRQRGGGAGAPAGSVGVAEGGIRAHSASSISLLVEAEDAERHQ